MVLSREEGGALSSGLTPLSSLLKDLVDLQQQVAKSPALATHLLAEKPTAQQEMQLSTYSLALSVLF